MKIAIQGHLTRGKEVIQILESLGGKNTTKLEGCYRSFYYIDDKNIISDDHKENFPSNYKLYTLEEFEKEFPFKIGDKVLINWLDTPFEIIALKLFGNKLCYKLDNGLHYAPETLTTYEEMKEERNITLTLEKAKEWYKKGGELKEIALQAFTEKELNPLPRSWEEYCRKYEYACLSTRYANIPLKYDALLKLEQLRDCWRQGNIPQEIKYKIRKVRNIYTVVYGAENAFLSFCDNQTAEEFLECFRDLIEKAGDLI